MRTGMIARKLGMSRVFNDAGEHVPVTVLRVAGCQVVAVKTQDKNGYTAVQLGAGEVKPSRLTKPMRGYFAKAGVTPRRKLIEFRVSAEAMLEVGDEIQADHFVVGQRVDVAGVSIGRGFAGAMKRHKFAGLRASHGVSISHRSHGSTGGRQDPGKVWKGKKMAGHMGDVRVTMQNLVVISTDPEKGLIAVSGSTPGAEGSWVIVTDAKKRPPKDVPMPGKIVKRAPPAGAAADAQGA